MRNRWKTMSVLVVIGVSAIAAQPVAGQATGIREVSASERSLIPLQTRLRYTTMIVLPWRLRRWNNDIISRPLRRSSAPVGSSARSSSG